MKVKIQIIRSSKTSGISEHLEIEGTVLHNDFDEHDTAGLLFALEFAGNGHSEIPMRVHISTEE